jgi:hypothetical protein
MSNPKIPPGFQNQCRMKSSSFTGEKRHTVRNKHTGVCASPRCSMHLYKGDETYKTSEGLMHEGCAHNAAMEILKSAGITQRPKTLTKNGFRRFLAEQAKNASADINSTEESEKKMTAIIQAADLLELEIHWKKFNPRTVTTK